MKSFSSSLTERVLHLRTHLKSLRGAILILLLTSALLTISLV